MDASNEEHLLTTMLVQLFVEYLNIEVSKGCSNISTAPGRISDLATFMISIVTEIWY